MTSLGTPDFEVKLLISWTVIGLEDLRESTAERDAGILFCLFLVVGTLLYRQTKYSAADHARKHGGCCHFCRLETRSESDSIRHVRQVKPTRTSALIHIYTKKWIKYLSL